MLESLVLFESVINSQWFLWTSIILFLNKIDVFKNKLLRVRSIPPCTVAIKRLLYPLCFIYLQYINIRQMKKI